MRSVPAQDVRRAARACRRHKGRRPRLYTFPPPTLHSAASCLDLRPSASGSPRSSSGFASSAMRTVCSSAGLDDQSAIDSIDLADRALSFKGTGGGCQQQENLLSKRRSSEHGISPRSISSVQQLLPNQSSRKWRRRGSNSQPPACKAGALPVELRPRAECGAVSPR
jgi:hypothetical protein